MLKIKKKLKKKLKLKLKKLFPGLIQVNNIFSFKKDLYSFQNNIRNSKNIGEKYSLAQKQYEILWDESLPKKPLLLILLKIQYRLSELAYIQSKVKIPEIIKQNIQASKDFNINKLTPDLREIIKIQLKSK